MQKHLLYINLFAVTSALAFGACADEVENAVTPDLPEVGEKTPIELSVGSAEAPSTRAVSIDGHGYITAFEKDTRLHLLMISDDATDPSPKPSEYTVTYAKAKGRGKAPSSTTNGTESEVSFASGDGILRFWDDTHARTSQLSIYGLAVANVVEPKGAPWYQRLCRVSDTNHGDAVNNFTGNKITPSVPWSTNPDDLFGTLIGSETGKWIIGDNTQGNNYTVQTMTSVLNKDDLCYSNNISSTGGAGGTDNRMKYNNTLTKKFDHGKMVFHRAMTLLTIKLYAGAGYDATSADNFQFTPTAGGKPTNIALKGFNKAGYLNIKNGTWSQVENGDWASIDNTDFGAPNLTGSGPYWTLLAFVIPGTNLFSTEQSDALSFTIDHNDFKVSMKDLYDAIKANDANCEGGVVKNSVLESGTNLKAGNNYEFSFVIKKTGIDNITAQLIDWETVNANDFYPENARITLNVEDRSGAAATSAVTSNMDIYRALDEAPSVTDTYEGYKWPTGYTTDGKATWNNEILTYNTDRWSTDWYWESNKTYYHFRTLSPTTQVVTADTENGDYTSVTSASCSNEAGYKQMSWGAPFLDVADAYKFTYSTTKGFDGTGTGHQIYKAIGPTKSEIKVLMFHMMSGVHLTIKTSEDADKVKLYDGANRSKVDLVGYFKDGKVLLGSGLVNTDGTISTEASPYNIPFASATDATEYVPQEYYFSAVPQDLTNVVLVITTPDNNQYKVKLWDSEHPITATVTNNNLAIQYAESSTAGKYKIDRWYPGFKYNYTFKLLKTGIEKITATIVEWEEVEAEEEEVTIK